MKNLRVGTLAVLVTALLLCGIASQVRPAPVAQPPHAASAIEPASLASVAMYTSQSH
jgi:hypothetical protein